MVTQAISPERLSIPLGGLTQAHVHLNFGGGQLFIGRAQPGVLISGTFDGGVIQKSFDPGRIELEPLEPARQLMAACKIEWHMDLTPEIPIDLVIDSGANQSKLDLSDIQVRTLTLKTGASDTEVILPAKGETRVRIECGFAHVMVDVPINVAAQVRGKISIGDTKVDTRRFPSNFGVWQSPDFDSATDRVWIEVKGGFGAVEIR